MSRWAKQETPKVLIDQRWQKVITNEQDWHYYGFPSLFIWVTRHARREKKNVASRLDLKMSRWAKQETPKV
jgi:hypothetical protein